MSMTPAKKNILLGTPAPWGGLPPAPHTCPLTLWCAPKASYLFLESPVAAQCVDDFSWDLAREEEGVPSFTMRHRGKCLCLVSEAVRKGKARARGGGSSSLFFQTCPRGTAPGCRQVSPEGALKRLSHPRAREARTAPQESLKSQVHQTPLGTSRSPLWSMSGLSTNS